MLMAVMNVNWKKWSSTVKNEPDTKQNDKHQIDKEEDTNVAINDSEIRNDTAVQVLAIGIQELCDNVINWITAFLKIVTVNNDSRINSFFGY